MTDEEFIAMFGCDRDTYDRILWENECRILNNAEEPNGSEAIGTYGSSKTSLSDNEFASSMRILISPKDGVVGETIGFPTLGVFGGMCKAHEAKLRERENRYNEILAMEKEDINVLHICTSKN